MNDNTSITVVMVALAAMAALVAVEVRGCTEAGTQAANKTAQACIAAGRPAAECQAIIGALPR